MGREKEDRRKSWPVPLSWSTHWYLTGEGQEKIMACPSELEHTLIFDWRRTGENHGLSLWAGAHTDIWLEKELLCTSLLLCPGNLCYGTFTLLNISFEAVNLLLIILLYLCMQQKFGLSQEHSVWLEFCHGWPLVISIASYKVQILYASSLCWQ
jgi:hypothetical protein